MEQIARRGRTVRRMIDMADTTGARVEENLILFKNTAFIRH